MIIITQLSFLYFIIINQEIYNKLSIFIVVTSIIITIINIFKNNIYLDLTSYILSLLSILFVRDKQVVNITKELYLFTWIRLIFKNKIIFMNIMGNIILYIPLYSTIKDRINKIILLISMFILIFINEFCQYILKVGVLDINDIILNYIGVLITFVTIEVYKWLKIKTNKSTKMTN